MSFKVIEPGFSATIQDLGRLGYQHQGVTQGGAMDQFSGRWANRLLGNSDQAAVLEITYGGVVLEAQADTSFAITGADLSATLNETELEPWQNYRIKRGDRLGFRSPRSGLRAYLAVVGGILSPVMLNSRSVVMREGIGGLNGRGEKLAVGDYIPFEESSSFVKKSVPASDIPDYDSDLEIGVICGYQFDEFSRIDVQRFFTSDYRITNNVDRMGYRLDGPALKPARSGIISEGISAGAIQVPADGKPIILMSDRQTIGGYPKLGSIFSLDRHLLAQRAPGAEVSFYQKDLAIAQAQRIIFQRSGRYFKL